MRSWEVRSGTSNFWNKSACSSSTSSCCSTAYCREPRSFKKMNLGAPVFLMGSPLMFIVDSWSLGDCLSLKMQVNWSARSTRKLVCPSERLIKMPLASLNLFNSLILETIGTHSLNKRTSLMNLTPSWPISWYICPFFGPIFYSLGSRSPRSGSLIRWKGFDTFLMLLTSKRSGLASVTPSIKGWSSAVVLNRSLRRTKS